MSDLEAQPNNQPVAVNDNKSSGKTKLIVLGLVLVVAIAVGVVLAVVFTRDGNGNKLETTAPVTNNVETTVVFKMNMDETSFNAQKDDFLSVVASSVNSDQSSFEVEKIVPGATDNEIFVYVTISGSSQAVVDDLASQVSQQATEGSYNSFNFAAFFANVEDVEVPLETEVPTETVAPTEAQSEVPTEVPTEVETTVAPTEVATTEAPKDPFLLRINSGNNIAPFIDANNAIWETDKYATAGVTKTYAGVTGIDLYDSERFFMGQTDKEGYSIPVPYAGTYRVKLVFVEVFFDVAGARIFHCVAEGININGGAIDIVALSGGKGVPAFVEKEITVTDGFLDINFFKQKQNPKISGIEIEYIQ